MDIRNWDFLTFLVQRIPKVWIHPPGNMSARDVALKYGLHWTPNMRVCPPGRKQDLSLLTPDSHLHLRHRFHGNYRETLHSELNGWTFRNPHHYRQILDSYEREKLQQELQESLVAKHFEDEMEEVLFE